MTTPLGTDIPLPRPGSISQPFWDGCRRGELLFQRCRDCHGITFIPQAVCSHCLRENLDWEKSSGRGTIYSYSVVWRPQSPAFQVPYVVAIMDIEDGYQMLSNIVDCDHSQVHVGMPVEVTFQRASDEITLPYFKPR